MQVVLKKIPFSSEVFAANLKLQRNQPTACATISRAIVSPNRRQGWLDYYLAIKR
jgi:hypothetical protein